MKAKVILLLLIVSLSSCATRKSKKRAVLNYKIEYPGDFIEICAELAPIKEFTEKQTVYIRGKDSVKKETKYIDCTTKKNANNDSVPVQFDIPIRVDTFIKTEIKTVENTNKITVLEKQLNNKNTLFLICLVLLIISLIIHFINYKLWQKHVKKQAAKSD